MSASVTVSAQRQRSAVYHSSVVIQLVDLLRVLIELKKNFKTQFLRSQILIIQSLNVALIPTLSRGGSALNGHNSEADTTDLILYTVHIRYII